MTEKLVGYALLAVGIIIIVYAAVNVVNVFTKKSEPFNTFNLPGISLDLRGLSGGEIPTGLGRSELIAPEVINAPLNLVFHLFFMGFIASIGFKIASLGVMLVRPIKVKLRGQRSAAKDTAS